jgi:hypothetical protein
MSIRLVPGRRNARHSPATFRLSPTICPALLIPYALLKSTRPG